jgi:hypothetical protein
MEYDGAAECLELGTGTIEGCDQALLTAHGFVEFGLDELDEIGQSSRFVAQFNSLIFLGVGCKG